MIDDESPADQLMAILQRVGARVTMDMRRSTALPCWRCDRNDVPRILLEVGRYTRGGMSGHAIERPLCSACAAAMGPVAPPPPAPHELASAKTGDLPRVAPALLADELAELAIATTSPWTRSRLLQALSLLDADTADALRAAMEVA